MHFFSLPCLLLAVILILHLFCPRRLPRADSFRREDFRGAGLSVLRLLFGQARRRPGALRQGADAGEGHSKGRRPPPKMSSPEGDIWEIFRLRNRQRRKRLPPFTSVPASFFPEALRGRLLRPPRGGDQRGRHHRLRGAHHQEDPLRRRPGTSLKTRPCIVLAGPSDLVKPQPTYYYDLQQRRETAISQPTHTARHLILPPRFLPSPCMQVPTTIIFVVRSMY